MCAAPRKNLRQQLIAVASLCVLLASACYQSDEDIASDGGTSDGGEEPSLVQVTSSGLPEGHIGILYSAQLTAAGGEAPYNWSLAGEKPPSWLSIDSRGALSGTPDQSGLSKLSVEARDSTGKVGRRELELQVLYVILMTGFGRFVGHEQNASWESIKPLEGERVGDFEVRTLELPTVWDEAPQQLFARMDQDRPAIVVSAGVADNATKLRLERTAQNTALGQDNLGKWKMGQIVAGGPQTYTTRLPLEALSEALESSLGAEISDDAGTFLCNYIFYQLMHRVQGTATVAGFIHTPNMSATLPVTSITQAWRAVLPALSSSSISQHALPAATVHSPPYYKGVSEPPQ